MMKMAGRVTSCCAALLFALTSVSAVQTLDSIEDLKRVDFGESVPEHSLLLLYWFAHTVNINNHDTLWLPFDPQNGDYGSHHYSNSEGLLHPPRRGQQYYTIGNIYQDTSVCFPPYVVNPRRQDWMGNRDRIIVRRSGQWIDQVYLTQHYDNSHHQGTGYDPQHTYQITANLIRQIREFSRGENHQSLAYLRDRFGGSADVSEIRNTWGDLACLGLFLCIVMDKQVYWQEQSRRRDNWTNCSPCLLFLLFVLVIVVFLLFASQLPHV